MNASTVLGADVPRETIERLEVYAELLRRWNPKINLVSPSTLVDLWTRHITDSLQLSALAKAEGHWVDLGSGGGFPGLVIAIANADRTASTTTLVESDQRKATFLRTVIRETGVSADVIAQRIETVQPLSADVLTARALAPLDVLLSFAERHRAVDGTCLFPKGETWTQEVAAAEVNWRFRYEAVPSKTNAASVILKIGEFSRG
ncbi:16S rRNA (guanine(527)-N(7))-methyltransferase RsmG [Pseudooceanicola sp.]|uniref:16S rRNA (guanine(527)-N(7))-methyltransferase RsmG n=1 Tax=Pseudooceanicola sp. TaxID=1914328 RepID=UPI0035154853